MLMGMKNAMSAVSKAFEKAVAFSDVGFLVLGLCPFWKMRHAQRRTLLQQDQHPVAKGGVIGGRFAWSRLVAQPS